MSIVGSLAEIAKKLNSGVAIPVAGTEEALEAIASKVTSGASADMSEYAKKSDITNVYKYKGSVETYAALPTTKQVAGDVYNVETADPTHGVRAGDNVAWNGTGWDVLAGTVVINEFAVHFTEDNATVTSDVTYANLVAAITAGKDVIAYFGGEMSNSVVYDSGNSKIVVEFIGISSTTLTNTVLEFAEAGTITKTATNYTLTAAA